MSKDYRLNHDLKKNGFQTIEILLLEAGYDIDINSRTLCFLFCDGKLEISPETLYDFWLYVDLHPREVINEGQKWVSGLKPDEQIRITDLYSYDGPFLALTLVCWKGVQLSEHFILHKKMYEIPFGEEQFVLDWKKKLAKVHDIPDDELEKYDFKDGRLK